MSSAPQSSATANLAARRLPERWALYALAALCGVALLLTGLLVTHRTSLAPATYVLATLCWLIGSLLSVLWDRMRGVPSKALWFNPLMLFFAIVAATYTIHALDSVPPKPLSFSPNQPDDLPGLYTNFTPYYLVLLAAMVLVVSWYSRLREHETEAGIAVLVVYTSLAFEHTLRAAGNELAPAVGTLSTPMLWGPLLVLFLMWRSDANRSGRTWRWTPLGGPLIALLAAGAFSTIFSIYAHASLLMLLRIAAFSSLLLLVANTVVGVRQVRLYWWALVAPLAGAAFVIVIKLWDINAHLGPGFVLSLRYQISGVAGTNPAGLSLGIGILLLMGAMIVERRWRWAYGLLLVFLLPAFLSTHSPSGLVALVVAMVGLVAFRFGYATWRAGPKRWGWVAASVGAIVLLLGLIATVPNPYTGKVSGDVTDPTTGRSVRGLVWRLAFESFRDNPLTGVGLQNYYGRTQHVGDFPSVDATRVGERRLLVKGTGEPWKLYVTSHPHNAYLAILETMGLPGLVALIWLAIALAAIGWRLFRRADGSFWWWASTVPLAGAGMALAWNIVAQGEDITVIALPFWPLIGISLGAIALFEPEQAAERSALWTRVTRPVARWWNGSTRRPVLTGLTALVFIAFVARPVAAEILVQKSDEAADVDNPRSLQMMRWAERLSPMSADYHERLSDAYLRNGSYRTALKEQTNVLNARRNFAPDDVRLGWLYWFGRDLDDAQVAFQQAVVLDRWDTTHGNVHMALGLAQAGAGNYDGALNTFAYGFSVSPSMLGDDAWVQDDSASLPVTYIEPSYLQSLDQGLPADLQRNILRRLELPNRRPELGPPDTAHDYSLTAVLDHMHAQYEGMLPLDTGRAEALLSTMGQLALDAELPDRAVSYYQELAQLQPGDEKVFYGLGLAYVALGDNTRATGAFERVLEISADKSELVIREPFSYFQLGLIALEKQPPDVEAARRQLQKARETYRWSYLPNLYRYLALAGALAGKTNDAHQAIDKELYLLNVSTNGGGEPASQPSEETGEPLAR